MLSHLVAFDATRLSNFLYKISSFVVLPANRYILKNFKVAKYYDQDCSKKINFALYTSNNDSGFWKKHWFGSKMLPLS